MVGAEEIIKKISVLEGEAEKTDAELSRTGEAAVAAYARGRVASVEKKVGDFLAQVTPLLLKVAKISRGQLVVSGGRIGAPGSVPERFGADDAEAVAEKQKQTIVAVLRRISQTGVTPSVALSLGKALSTLYALSDGADAFYDAYFREEKQRAAELRASLEKRKKQLSDELGGLKRELDARRGALESAERRFRFDGMSVAADYAAPVSLPVCAAEAGGMLIPRKWRLSDDRSSSGWRTGRSPTAWTFCAPSSCSFCTPIPLSTNRFYTVRKRRTGTWTTFCSRWNGARRRGFSSTGCAR